MGFELLASALIVAALLAPLYLVYRRHEQGKAARRGLILQIVCFFGVGAAMVALGFHQAALAAGAVTDAGADTAVSAAASGVTDFGFGMIAAALSTGLSGIGGGIAVSASASAALGAISENEKMFGRALIFVGLAEGIALYGLIISFMILGRF